MANIIDLDKVIGREITITFKEKKYSLRSDIPTERALKMLELLGSLGSDKDADVSSRPEKFRLTLSFLSEVFVSQGHTDFTMEFLLANMSWKQATFLLNHMVEELVIRRDDEGGEDPSTPQKT